MNGEAAKEAGATVVYACAAKQVLHKYTPLVSVDKYDALVALAKDAVAVRAKCVVRRLQRQVRLVELAVVRLVLGRQLVEPLAHLDHLRSGRRNLGLHADERLLLRCEGWPALRHCARKATTLWNNAALPRWVGSTHVCVYVRSDKT